MSIFQFHKGTIRTSYIAAHRSSLTKFQFHKGTIRTRQAALQEDGKDGDFNSIKVRLEQEHDGCALAEGQFQFHKGTIRTLCRTRNVAAHIISIP